MPAAVSASAAAAVAAAAAAAVAEPPPAMAASMSREENTQFQQLIRELVAVDITAARRDNDGGGGLYGGREDGDGDGAGDAADGYGRLGGYGGSAMPGEDWVMNDSFDQISYIIKQIFQSGRSAQFVDQLTKFAGRKDAEIETMCRYHYEEFVNSVDQLLKIRVGTQELKRNLNTLNHEVQAVSRKTLDQKRQMIKYRQTLLHLELATELLQNSWQIMDTLTKIPKQLEQRKYSAALRMLDDIESRSLPALHHLAFGPRVRAAVDAYQAKIRQLVLTDVRQWFHSAQAQTLELGARVLAKSILVQAGMAHLAHHPHRGMSEGGDHVDATSPDGRGGDRHNGARHDGDEDANEKDQDDEEDEEDDDEDDDDPGLLLDIKPLYAGLYIHDMMNRRSELKASYEEHRRSHANTVLSTRFTFETGFPAAASTPGGGERTVAASAAAAPPPPPWPFHLIAPHGGPRGSSSLPTPLLPPVGSYERYLAGILGFFLKEAQVLRSTQNFLSRGSLEAVWDTAVDRLVSTTEAALAAADVRVVERLRPLAHAATAAMERAGFSVFRLADLHLSLSRRFAVCLVGETRAQLHALTRAAEPTSLTVANQDAYDRILQSVKNGAPPSLQHASARAAPMYGADGTRIAAPLGATSLAAADAAAAAPSSAAPSSATAALRSLAIRDWAASLRFPKPLPYSALVVDLCRWLHDFVNRFYAFHRGPASETAHAFGFRRAAAASHHPGAASADPGDPMGGGAMDRMPAPASGRRMTPSAHHYGSSRHRYLALGVNDLCHRSLQDLISRDLCEALTDRLNTSRRSLSTLVQLYIDIDTLRVQVRWIEYNFNAQIRGLGPIAQNPDQGDAVAGPHAAAASSGGPITSGDGATARSVSYPETPMGLSMNVPPTPLARGQAALYTGRRLAANGVALGPAAALPVYPITTSGLIAVQLRCEAYLFTLIHDKCQDFFDLAEPNYVPRPPARSGPSPYLADLMTYIQSLTSSVITPLNVPFRRWVLFFIMSLIERHLDRELMAAPLGRTNALYFQNFETDVAFCEAAAASQMADLDLGPLFAEFRQTFAVLKLENMEEVMLQPIPPHLIAPASSPAPSSATAAAASVAASGQPSSGQLSSGQPSSSETNTHMALYGPIRLRKYPKVRLERLVFLLERLRDDPDPLALSAAGPIGRAGGVTGSTSGAAAAVAAPAAPAAAPSRGFHFWGSAASTAAAATAAASQASAAAKEAQIKEQLAARRKGLETVVKHFRAAIEAREQQLQQLYSGGARAPTVPGSSPSHPRPAV